MRNLGEMFLRSEKQKSDPENQRGIYIYKSKEGISTILITTLDVKPKFLEDIIVTTRRKFLRKGDRLVYLTDNSDFTIFRRHGVIFEYLPSLLEQRLHATHMPWQSYLRERWGLLLAKWRPRHVLAYGANIDSFLAAAPVLPARTTQSTPNS